MRKSSCLGLKYYFLKENYKNRFELKLLSKVVGLVHINDNMTNVIVLNNGFTIVLKVIDSVMNKDFIVYKNFNYLCLEKRYYRVLKNINGKSI